MFLSFFNCVMKDNDLCPKIEETVLLVIGVLFDDACGVAIQEELQLRRNRKATRSMIHVALHRLEKKGYLESRFDGATQERGGRGKLFVSGHSSSYVFKKGLIINASKSLF